MTLRNLALVSTASILMTVPAMAEGLRDSYVGTGAAVGLNGQGAAATLVGRAAVPAGSLMLSLRPQLNFAESVEGAIGATLDVPVAADANIYVGGGVALRDEDSTGILTVDDDTVGYAQVGAEYGLAESLALYGDVKVAFGAETRVVPTVGLAYRF